MYVQGSFKFGNEKAFVDHKLIRGRARRNNFKVIKGSRMTSVVKVLKNGGQFWVATFVTYDPRKPSHFQAKTFPECTGSSVPLLLL